jgi:hypothetical protein
MFAGLTEHAIVEFIDWYCSEPRLRFNKGLVTRYRTAVTENLLYFSRSTSSPACVASD